MRNIDVGESFKGFFFSESSNVEIYTTALDWRKEYGRRKIVPDFFSSSSFFLFSRSFFFLPFHIVFTMQFILYGCRSRYIYLCLRRLLFFFNIDGRAKKFSEKKTEKSKQEKTPKYTYP